MLALSAASFVSFVPQSKSRHLINLGLANNSYLKTARIFPKRHYEKTTRRPHRNLTFILRNH